MGLGRDLAGVERRFVTGSRPGLAGTCMTAPA